MTKELEKLVENVDLDDVDFTDFDKDFMQPTVVFSDRADATVKSSQLAASLRRHEVR